MGEVLKRDDSVFVVHHSYERDDIENVCFIGVYSSRISAESAVERLRGQPGFRDYPKCFTIEEYSLDEDHWTEGFVTIVPIQVKLQAGPEEWTTVHAELQHHTDRYQIISFEGENETDWQFKGGDVVACEERDGILYAVELAERKE
ncbi:MAG: hypothetical protein QNJ30_22935 [Kiloniellales bacterium]|nr:hypothetical protein [Kiloniellales bacterium]